MRTRCSRIGTKSFDLEHEIRVGRARRRRGEERARRLRLRDAAQSVPLSDELTRAAQRRLEHRLDLGGEPLERLVVERRRAVDVDVLEAEVEVRRPASRRPARPGRTARPADRANPCCAPLIASATFRASASVSRMIGTLPTSVRSISVWSRPTSSHQRRSTSSLCLTRSRSPPVFQRVGVLRDRVQRLPLAAAADHDRQVLLHGRRVVEDVLRVVEAPARRRRAAGEHRSSSARPPRRTSRAARRSPSRTGSRTRCARSRTRRRRSRATCARRSCGRAS